MIFSAETTILISNNFKICKLRYLHALVMLGIGEFLFFFLSEQNSEFHAKQD